MKKKRVYKLKPNAQGGHEGTVSMKVGEKSIIKTAADGTVVVVVTPQTDGRSA